MAYAHKNKKGQTYYLHGKEVTLQNGRQQRIYYFARESKAGEALDALPPGRHCFEFRHPSWFAPDVIAMLREHDVALVIGDHPERPFQEHELTAEWTFVRFHYGRRGRHGSYSQRELDEWAGRIRRWRRSIEVFAYFNNDWEGFAVRNGVGLRERLGA